MTWIDFILNRFTRVEGCPEAPTHNCVYLTSDGDCSLYSAGGDVVEPCVQGPCDDERTEPPGKEDAHG